MSKYRLVVFGVVALVALTGCLNGLGGNGDTGGGDGANLDTGNQTTVAVAVGLDAEAQEELSGMLNTSEQQLLQRAQFAPGNLTQEEQQRAQQIQQDMQTAQQEAVQEAGAEFESAVNASRTLTVQDSIQQGSSSLYLVSGSPSEIVGLLNRSGVQAMTSREQFEAIRQQQQQQSPTAPGGAPAPSP